MAIVWKINGSTFEELGIERPVLKLVNQLADTLSFEIPGDEFDADLAFDIDDAITLTRQDGSDPAVTWFVGAIRETPRSQRPGGSGTAYEARGPWQWLERIAFLQTFKLAIDATDPSSSLTSFERGRIVIAQNDSGIKITLGAFLNAVLDFAIAAKPSTFQRANFAASGNMTITIPWDEVTDLSCAEVIQRVLQWLPDAVAWWDYTLSPPKLNIARRDDLNVLRLNVQRLTGETVGTDDEPVVDLETIELRDRPDLFKDKVCLIYLATNRANEAQWETATVDAVPVVNAGSFVTGKKYVIKTHGTTSFTAIGAANNTVGTIFTATGAGSGSGTAMLLAPSDPDCLTRTIRLAGSVFSDVSLQQQVNIDPIPSDLVFSGAVTSGGSFSTLSSWWKAHAPELKHANVTIKAFLDGSRKLASGSSVSGSCENELVKGAVTDWMISRQGILVEDQIVTIGVDYEIADPANSSKKERVVKQLSVPIKGTNAQTKTYSFTTETSFTPAEAVPTGLAQALYDALIVSPQYDGQFVACETDCSMAQPMPNTITLADAAITLDGMIVQQVEIDIDEGKTRFVVGPPRHLGPDDLVELYRANRNREPVTSHYTRTTGVSGSSSSKQGLALHAPQTQVAGGAHTRPRVFTKTLSVAGAVPTSTEVQTALASGWSSPDHPIAGDVIQLTVSGVVKLRYLISLTSATTEGLKVVSFTVSSVTYYGFGTQSGIY